MKQKERMGGGRDKDRDRDCERKNRRCVKNYTKSTERQREKKPRTSADEMK